MSAAVSADRSVFRRILPMIQACSQVKCANVNDFSSRTSSATLRVIFGRASSIVSESSEKCDLMGGRSSLLWSRETGYRFIDKMLRYSVREDLGKDRHVALTCGTAGMKKELAPKKAHTPVASSYACWR